MQAEFGFKSFRTFPEIQDGNHRKQDDSGCQERAGRVNGRVSIWMSEKNEQGVQEAEEYREPE